MIWGLEGRHLWVPPGPTVLPKAFLLSGRPLTLRDYILWLGPSLYWPLDATYGATDQSGNGRNGTGQGGVSIGGATALTPIPGDAATNFDGSNDYISSTYDPFVVGSKRTFLGIASRDTSSTDDYLVGAAEGSVIGLLAGGQQMFYPGSPNATWPGNATITRWAVTADDSGANTLGAVYINGVLNASGAYGAGSAFAALSGYRVGADLAGSHPFDGQMAHVAVVERLLSAEEIAGFNYFASNYPVPPTVTLNRVVDDAGARLFPCYDLEDIGGLMSTGESGDRRDVKVGAQGEIPRRGRRRGKTISYTGKTKATSLASLRAAESALTQAFDDQTAEGLMVVTPHPLYDTTPGVYRYFSAKSLMCEIDDGARPSPMRSTLGHETPFVITVRNARAGGVSYKDQAGNSFA